MINGHTIFSPLGGKAKKVAYTATAGTTTALPDETTAISVVCTTDAFVRINATAVVDTDLYVVGLIPVVLQCPKAATVSAVKVNSDGTLYVTPLA